MIFFSYQFAVFTALFFLLYWIAPWSSLRRLLLLCACLTFHIHFAGPAGVAPIIFLATGTYFVGRSRRSVLCAIWITVCVVALLFYKYTHFLFQSVLALVSAGLADAGHVAAVDLLPALPPLGISFFTFEFVHYLIEVRRGNAPIRSPLSFSLFVLFWPSLVAGPVKRYRQFLDSMASGVVNIVVSDIAAGMFRVAIGIVEKYIADILTEWIQHHDKQFDALPLGWRWAIFIAIGLRILFDFSGYSHMAIGFARMFGIRLPENFNWPYLARGIDDFWRRWHISLSSWIRDYIYIPLGGNRHGVVRKSLNGLTAMALCGLWHGAAWNFLLWGVYHGVGLALTSSIPAPPRLSFAALVSDRPLAGAAILARGISRHALSWAATMLFVLVGWLLFFYPVGTALHMMNLLFDPVGVFQHFVGLIHGARK